MKIKAEYANNHRQTIIKHRLTPFKKIFYYLKNFYYFKNFYLLQGGGQKIQILRKALEPYKDRKDLIILFVDAFVFILSDYQLNFK